MNGETGAGVGRSPLRVEERSKERAREQEHDPEDDGSKGL
jgi:hypothetical protein